LRVVQVEKPLQMWNQDVVKASEKAPHEEERGDHRHGAVIGFDGDVRAARGRRVRGCNCHDDRFPLAGLTFPEEKLSVPSLTVLAATDKPLANFAGERGHIFPAITAVKSHFVEAEVRHADSHDYRTFSHQERRTDPLDDACRSG